MVMRVWSYVIYAIIYEAIAIVGTAYVVFVLGYSGWWWLLGVLFSAGITPPERWSSLWDSDIANKYRDKKKD